MFSKTGTEGDNPNLNGELWFICMYCRRAYREVKSLLRHKKQLHKELLIQRIKEKKQSRLANIDVSKIKVTKHNVNSLSSNGKVGLPKMHLNEKGLRKISSHDSEDKRTKKRYFDEEQRHTRTSTRKCIKLESKNETDEDDQVSDDESISTTNISKNSSSPSKKKRSTKSSHPFSSRGYRRRKGAKKTKYN